MYICDFSRSVGAGRAMTRKTRGLTRSVIALIVPPLPAPSRPSKTMHTFAPVCATQSWSFTSSTCSLRNALSYAFLDRSAAEAPSEAAMLEGGLGSGRAAPLGAGVVLLFARTFMIDRSPSNGYAAGLRAEWVNAP